MKRVSLIFLFIATVTMISFNALASTYHLGKEIEISQLHRKDASHERPAVAWNSRHNEYLMVWHAEWHTYSGPPLYYIHAQRVSKTGELLGKFEFRIGGDCKYPAVAYNFIDDNYMIVWSRYNGPYSRWEIYGRIINWDSIGINAQFVIAAWSSMNLQVPAVAYGGNIATGHNDYMVVWQTSHATTGILQGIGRRRVNANGSLPGNADYVTPPSGLNQGSPDIAYHPSSDEYLVVWVEPYFTNLNIYGGRLNYQGTLQGSKFNVYPSMAYEQQTPAVVTDHLGGEYLVVWMERFSTVDWDICGARRDVNGNLSSTKYWYALTADDEKYPAVALNGATQEYLVVWERYTGSGASIMSKFCDDIGHWQTIEIAPGGFGDNRWPAVAFSLSGYFIGYGWRSFIPHSDSDIYGTMWLKNRAMPWLQLLLLD